MSTAERATGVGGHQIDLENQDLNVLLDSTSFEIRDLLLEHYGNCKEDDKQQHLHLQIDVVNMLRDAIEKQGNEDDDSE